MKLERGSDLKGQRFLKEVAPVRPIRVSQLAIPFCCASQQPDGRRTTTCIQGSASPTFGCAFTQSCDVSLDVPGI